ncbi:MAG: hypothetical protein Q7V20_18540 [Aquabacterium sp.]|uniref:hypothetical protein n=1 Tax=Aquabacterium sp. TaxID=1872578 RepID=UPI002725C4AA|nr:hypothetical protein [Aquabacterium sp.]MDO9005448.1 hypothetical protein [Aquabacterium sp.]
MHRTARRLSWLAPLVGALCAPAFAGGTLFRCGSSYQDRPCDAGQPSKVIGSNGASREQPAVADSAPVDAVCAERVTRAKQIVWAKESGKTAEVQLATATSEGERRLIADVYSRRGSSVAVGKGVEADCMAERARAAQAAALIEAASKLQAQGSPALSPAPAESARPAETAVPRQAATAQAALAAKTARCQAVKGQLDDVTTAQRAGGTMAHMEQLNRQRQTAAKAWRDAGC